MTMQPDDTTDDAVLAALLAGERDPADPEVAALLRTRPRLNDRFQRLRGLAQSLDAAGAGDRERWSAATATPTPLDDMAMTATAQFLSGPRRRTLTVWVAAAALLLGALGTFLLSRPPAADEHSTLGVAANLMWPQGETKQYGPFGWRHPLPAEGSFVVRIYTLGGFGHSTPLLQSMALTANEWRPTPAQLQALPDRIEWVVEASDQLGVPIQTYGPVAVQRVP